MSQSRTLRQKSQKYQDNIEKRGIATPKKKEEGLNINPYVLGFIIFVVIGSSKFYFFITPNYFVKYNVINIYLLFF
ncbi:hypothetical protein RB653_002352 [Dictyostelium firmibasis]|uniref:Stress-associated endoplasmic reticulum protein n=1 Tax=Dictyostelium firmibasis TaxID=79012 RepID=A0AAN7YPZ7_9MYCE